MEDQINIVELPSSKQALNTRQLHPLSDDTWEKAVVKLDEALSY